MEADRFDAALPLLRPWPRLPTHGGTERPSRRNVFLQQVPSRGWFVCRNFEVWLRQLPESEPEFKSERFLKQRG
jgi:hypothetical protein